MFKYNTEVFLSVLNVTASGIQNGKLDIILRIEKKITTKVLWFKPKITSVVRELVVDNYHDRRGYFHFSAWDCPETKVGMSYDDGYCYLVTRPTEMYPFHPITRNTIRKLLDKWWADRGHSVSGSWPD